MADEPVVTLELLEQLALLADLHSLTAAPG
jgi:hypothetical protein